MRILVTGAAGFIGSNFVFYMMDKHPEYEITAMDSLIYAGNMATLEPVMDNDRFHFVKCDVADREGVFEAFRNGNFDVVVNFAAKTIPAHHATIADKSKKGL